MTTAPTIWNSATEEVKGKARTYRPERRKANAEGQQTKTDRIQLRYRCGRCGAPKGAWCLTRGRMSAKHVYGQGLVQIPVDPYLAIELHRDRWAQASRDNLLPLPETLRKVGLPV